MYLNMHLLRSHMNRRNLFGMGIGVYWTIVLVVSFRVQAGNQLDDMEMMKRVGGQSNNGAYCVQRIDCKSLSCPSCTDLQVNGPCYGSPNIKAVGQTGYYTETCARDGNLETCAVTGINTKARCIDYYSCNCRKAIDGNYYCYPGAVYDTNCANIDVGQTCSYTVCPP